MGCDSSKNAVPPPEATKAAKSSESCIQNVRKITSSKRSACLKMLKSSTISENSSSTYFQETDGPEFKRDKRRNGHLNLFIWFSKHFVNTAYFETQFIYASCRDKTIKDRGFSDQTSTLFPKMICLTGKNKFIPGDDLVNKCADLTKITDEAYAKQVKKTETEIPRSQSEIPETQGLQDNGQGISEPQGPQGSHDNDVITSSDVLEEHQPESINYSDTHDVNEQVPPGTSIQWSHAENYVQETDEEEEETAPVDVQETPETAASENAGSNDGEQNVQAGTSSVPEWLKKITKIQTAKESRRENLEISKGIFVQEWQALNEIQAFEILDEFETNLLLRSWLVRGIRPQLLEEKLRFEIRRHLQEALADAESEIQDWIMNKSGKPYLDRRDAYLQHQSQKLKQSLRETFELKIFQLSQTFQVY